MTKYLEEASLQLANEMHDSVVGLMSACADVNESSSLRDIKQFLLHLCKEQREIVLFFYFTWKVKP